MRVRGVLSAPGTESWSASQKLAFWSRRLSTHTHDLRLHPDGTLRALLPGWDAVLASPAIATCFWDRLVLRPKEFGPVEFEIRSAAALLWVLRAGILLPWMMDLPGRGSASLLVVPAVVLGLEWILLQTARRQLLRTVQNFERYS